MSRRKRYFDVKLLIFGVMGEKGVDFLETVEFEVNNEEEVIIFEIRELIDGLKEYLKLYLKRVVILIKVINLKGYGFK